MAPVTELHVTEKVRWLDIVKLGLAGVAGGATGSVMDAPSDQGESPWLLMALS